MFFVLCLNLAVFSSIAVFLMHQFFGIDKPETVLESIPQTPNEVNAFLFVQAIISLGGFLITSISFARLESVSVLERLNINFLAPLKMFVLAVVSILLAQFFIEFLVEANTKIPLPDALNFLKDYAKKAEDVTTAVMNFKQFGQFIAVAIVMAVIPAISEEMFFRGLFMGALLRAKVNPVVAIISSGFVFAISHMEYQNTIAIWALGAFLGYLYYISGSIWLSFVAHFTNNFLMVLLKYLYNIGVIGKDMADASMPLYITFISIVLFAGCIYIFNKWKQPDTFEEATPDIVVTNE